MTDPQAWTLIGVLSAAMLSGLTVVATMLTRVVRAEVGGLRGELKGEIGGLRGEVMGEIGALRAEMHGRFATVDSRLDDLDRDVQTLSERMWRGEQHD